MGLKLFLHQADGRREIPIIEFPCTIGRDESCTIPVNDVHISRTHARIVQGRGRFFLEDTKSRNGTFVNGERIGELTQLEHGDDIRFGQNVWAVVLIDNPPETKPQQPPASRPSGIQDSATLQVLLDISKNLTSSLDYRVVLSRVIDAVIELTGVERGFLLLNTAEGLRTVIARNHEKAPLNPDNIRVSKGALQQIVEANKPIYVVDVPSDEVLGQQASVAALHLQTILGVPLHVYQQQQGQQIEKLVGIIYADSTRANLQEAQRLLDVLSALAGHAAVAIENARMHAELLEKERLEEDLKIAREIQESLMPKTVPSDLGLEIAASNHPLRHVGGDYYQLSTLADGRPLVAIADVMGKGLPASLIMATLHASLNALCLGMTSLDEMVGNLNDFITEQNARNKFITFFVGIIEGRVLRYVNAGHNPPLLFRADGSFEELGEGGMLLGVQRGNVYAEGSVELAEGDLLLLYTDGLIEGTDQQNEEFGEERVHVFGQEHRGLEAKKFVDALNAALLEFLGEEPLTDDLTLIAMRVPQE
jgi:phosphoserine phosphatase RsbU/P